LRFLAQSQLTIFFRRSSQLRLYCPHPKPL
jgi:hypothetical protein